MPHAPLRPCPHPGCPSLVRTGRCAQHSAQHRTDKAQRLSAQRGTTAERGYGSRWQARASRFRQRYPLCGMRPNNLAPVMSRCHDEGRVTVAAQVDHVVPHKGDQRLFWDELGNWQSLCAACGAAKSRAGL